MKQADTDLKTPMHAAYTRRGQQLFSRWRCSVRGRLRRIVNLAKQTINARWMFGQFIPLQTLNRTVFEYDVVYSGDPDVYWPEVKSLEGAPNLSICLWPQAFSPPYHYRVKNAVLSGLDIIDPEAPTRVLMELLTNPVPITEGRAWTFDAAKRRRTLRRAEGETVQAGDAYVFSTPNWTNYYHFLIDAAARFVELKDAGAIRDDTEIFFHGEINEWQSQYLRLLGLRADRLSRLPAAGEPPLRAKSVLIGSAPRARLACPPRSIERLRQVVLSAAQGTNAEGTRRLYISRGDAAKRRLLNEAELLPILENEGFEILTLECMPVAQQLALFREALVIVAPHGAGLTNMIWSDRPTIIELLPADRWNLGGFATLAHVIGSRYQPVVANYDEPKAYIRSDRDDRDYAIAPHLVQSALHAVVAGSGPRGRDRTPICREAGATG
ncbi:MAG: glycosyltransferase family 61 protein [Jannaschia sp.]